jgi:hypothetical protein
MSHTHTHTHTHTHAHARAQGALLGAGAVSLAALAEGGAVEGDFPLGGSGTAVSLAVSWARPLALAGEGACGGVSAEGAAALNAWGGADAPWLVATAAALSENGFSALCGAARAVAAAEASWVGGGGGGVRGTWAAALRAAGESAGGSLSPPAAAAALAAHGALGPAAAPPAALLSALGAAVAAATGASSTALTPCHWAALLAPPSPLAAGALAAVRRAAAGARGTGGGGVLPLRAALEALGAADGGVTRAAFAGALRAAGIAVGVESEGEGGAPLPPPGAGAQDADTSAALLQEAAAALAAAGGGGDGDVSDVSVDAAVALGGGGGGEGEAPLLPFAMTAAAAAAEAAAAAAEGAAEGAALTDAAVASELTCCHAGAPSGFETITALSVTVGCLSRVAPPLAAALAGATPLLSFRFPGAPGEGPCGVLRARAVGGGAWAFDPWALAPGAGKTFGVCTSA